MTARLPQHARGGCEHCPAAHHSIFVKVRSRASDVVDTLRAENTFATRETIPFRKGKRDGFWCVRSGYVKLSYAYAGLSRPVRICGPGDLVGYGHWHDDYRLVAEALEPVSGCFFERDRFLALQREVPDINDGLVKLTCRVAVQNAQRIAFLQSRSVRSRVAGLLTSLERKFGERTERGSRIPVRVDRKTLAGLSGTVVETLARTLTEFEDEGWISRDGRAIHVHDSNALNALAHEP